MNAFYYKASGKISEYFILYFVLVMALALPILSNAYIYIIYHMPFVHLNFLFTLGCGLALGALVNHTVRFGKARSPLAVFMLTIVALCALKYIQWCVYIPLVVAEAYGFPMSYGQRFAESLYYMARPGAIWQAARIIRELGVWGFGASYKVNGIMLQTIWTAEFVIMGAAALMLSWEQPRRPFSEAADGWYGEMKEKAAADMPENFASLKNNPESSFSDGLIKLIKTRKPDKPSFLSITFYQPPEGSAGEPYYLSIEQIAHQKGKAKAKTLVNYRAVSEEGVRRMIDSNTIGAKRKAVADTVGEAAEEAMEEAMGQAALKAAVLEPAEEAGAL